MKNFYPHSVKRYLPPAVLAGSLLAAYLATLAPGLTWANGGSDGGDLIAAAATGGVPHPTGYPLYLLLAQFFQLMPVGSLAFRTNLMSAVFAALAAMVVYELVLHSLSSPEAGWPVALASSYAFGLAPLVWSQAVITEVYSLHAFLIALIIYLYAKANPPQDAAQKRLDRWRGLALGLAMGNHVTTLLILPVAFVMGSVNRRVLPEDHSGSGRSAFANLKLDGGALLRQLGTFAAGLCIYLILPLRALAQPPVNWGNVITPSRFWWLASGQLYQSYYLQSGLPEAWAQIQSFAAIFVQQFGLAGLLLGLIGLIVFGRAARLYVLTIWTAFAFIAFAVMYGSADAYVYLIPVVVSFSIWVGLGVSGLIHPIAQRYRFSGLLLGLIVTGYFASRYLLLVNQVDASRDLRAESFSREVFSKAPKNAIVFAGGDEAVFALWYSHFALGERPDLMIVATDLLHFDWYAETLRRQYVSLKIPGPFPWPETIIQGNPSLPVCYVQSAEQPLIDCRQPGGDG